VLCAVQAVILLLGEMMQESSALILPSIEALANLCLTPEQQVRLAIREVGCN